MEVKLSYRGRELSAEDLAFIRALIARHPEASRRALSKLLCQAWDWRQPNGALRDMVCRGLMLALHRGGLIELPPLRCRPPNNAVRHGRPQSVEVDSTALRAELSALRPLEFRQVRRQADEELCDSLIAEHHYLGFVRPVGENLKYLVFAGARPVACVLWCSPARRLAPRDRFIGWSPEARERNLHSIAYNSRFLIPPWVAVPHLASHILGAMARRLAADWEALYGHPVHYLETFVDPARYRGTCYRAANWISLGRTTGRGKDAPSGRPRVPVKEILGYPLTKRFRELLGRGQ